MYSEFDLTKKENEETDGGVNDVSLDPLWKNCGEYNINS